MEKLRLEMNDITKTFPGVLALDKAKLHLRPGTVHALMGENGAGKSTLMKCLFGIYKEDSGEIFLDGEKVNIESSKKALELGISMIHQELHPIPFRSVMENIWLGRFPKNGFVIDHKGMYNKTKDLFKQLEIDINPTVEAGTLSVSKLQLLEIAKAVSFNSRIIVMDEPTSSLTETEVAYLFKIVRKLRSEGRSIIYISHKMEEILEISDDVTIMRDGQYVGTWEAKDLTTDMIINKMVGRDLTQRFPEKTYKPQKEVALELKNFNSINPKWFRNVNLKIYKGEVLGIGGLVGAGRTELVESIFGLRSLESGEMYKNGKKIENSSAKDAISNGFALLTEERRVTGIFGVLSILDNTVIASLDQFSKAGVLNDSKMYSTSKDYNAQLKTKTPSMEALIQNLSGGNQQKVLIARWLITNPDILILDEPTRGIDVGAKFEIYSIINDLAKQGKTIIMISSEMPELLGMSDRVMVMCEGEVKGVLEGSDATQLKVMQLAAQRKDKN